MKIHHAQKLNRWRFTNPEIYRQYLKIWRRIFDDPWGGWVKVPIDGCISAKNNCRTTCSKFFYHAGNWSVYFHFDKNTGTWLNILQTVPSLSSHWLPRCFHVSHHSYGGIDIQLADISPLIFKVDFRFTLADKASVGGYWPVYFFLKHQKQKKKMMKILQKQVGRPYFVHIYKVYENMKIAQYMYILYLWAQKTYWAWNEYLFIHSACSACHCYW